MAAGPWVSLSRFKGRDQKFLKTIKRLFTYRLEDLEGSWNWEVGKHNRDPQTEE